MVDDWDVSTDLIDTIVKLKWEKLGAYVLENYGYKFSEQEYNRWANESKYEMRRLFKRTRNLHHPKTA